MPWCVVLWLCNASCFCYKTFSFPGCGTGKPLGMLKLPFAKKHGQSSPQHRSIGTLENGSQTERPANRIESTMSVVTRNTIDASEFLLKTTPRYWEKQIRKLDMKRYQTIHTPRVNPYAERSKLVTRQGSEVQGWSGLPLGNAPASWRGSSVYEFPYPRKAGAPISPQRSFGSTSSSLGRQSPRLRESSSPRSKHRVGADSGQSPRPSRDRANLPSLCSEGSYTYRRKSFHVSPEQKHLLEGHVMRGRRSWRRSSTFGDLARMRIEMDVPDSPLPIWLRQNSFESCTSVESQSSDWSLVRRKSEQRQEYLLEDEAIALSKDLVNLEAIEDLLEIRRDSSGGWYHPHGKCLHWSEQQLRVAKDRQNKMNEFEEKFGINSVAFRWNILARRIIHHSVKQRLIAVTAENDWLAITRIQRTARRFLRVKRARAMRAERWKREHAAAAKIQAVKRGITDRIYSRFVRKCRPILDSNANVFAAHKAFVRAKRDYTGTVEPPFTAAAFANMGDASGAVTKERCTLRFVEFCHALNDHLTRATTDLQLARRASMAVCRTDSAERGLFGRISSGGSGIDNLQASRPPSVITASPVAPAQDAGSRQVNSIAPFAPSQDRVLQMTEATARLIYLYDNTRLGILSGSDFWSACREVYLNTGVAFKKLDCVCALRYTRNRGGVSLDMMCALQEMSHRHTHAPSLPPAPLHTAGEVTTPTLSSPPSQASVM